MLTFEATCPIIDIGSKRSYYVMNLQNFYLPGGNFYGPRAIGNGKRRTLVVTLDRLTRSFVLLKGFLGFVTICISTVLPLSKRRN